MAPENAEAPLGVAMLLVIFGANVTRGATTELSTRAIEAINVLDASIFI